MPVARLSSRALIAVTGPESRPFLHNLLTQDVETLSEGELRFGALLSPPGRLLFDLFILGQAEGVLLDVAADRRDALIQRLSMYRLRAKVQVAADDRPVFAAWPDAPTGFIPDPRTPLMGGRLYGPATADATEADYDAHRLSVGVPDPAADAPQDKTYPIEADFDLLNGIDFHKGCFVGQETTSRMKRRGSIKNRMLVLDFDGPPPPFGAEVPARPHFQTRKRLGAAFAPNRKKRMILGPGTSRTPLRSLTAAITHFRPRTTEGT